MTSSLTEAISETAEHIHEKLVPHSLYSPASDRATVQEALSTEEPAPPVQVLNAPASEQHREPLKLSGVLDRFESFDVTPVIGREYVDVNLAGWLKAPNSDELLRNLAITIFFRKQDDVTNDLQKELVQRLSRRAFGQAFKLHIHPVSNSGREFGGKDDEINDTLWASGYEVYDRISRLVQKFLETLTATYAQPGFKEAADKNGFKLYSAERGAPENVGEKLEAVHPVVRTNPVTGVCDVLSSKFSGTKLISLTQVEIDFRTWPSVSHINDPTAVESDALLAWFLRLVVDNHDLQYHVATPDYINQGLGERAGQRAMILGEGPYFDTESTGRREGLEKVQ
ncbi:putative Alpha-ketoglutarate-dependent taurine dioxygenase [Sclerotinia borealis F-4128]|uniref:Putative Alpha-ketoglutarate-dependent taurine dioxygenase n=1 Tax=Sclerotinia borealis (strain F-4128) TaxID=1432307 RepID=W9CCT4_SCLBF|nr:putative Alpha-ketoglutarate-dependent taurine dioxygenase [Sclerotinia borealis F-4128]